MSKKKRIEEALKEALHPEELEVIDESHKHIGHEGNPDGDETHFRIRIQAKSLSGLPRLKQHRKIYEAMGDIDYHALAIELS